MLDLGLIESLLASNYLLEYHLKALESVLRNYFIATKL